MGVAEVICEGVGVVEDTDTGEEALSFSLSKLKLVSESSFA